jgi:type I restriction enzyme S subunit
MPFVSIDSRKEYLYSVLNSDSFHTYMVQSSSSSTGSRKRIGPELCLCFLFASPKNDAIVKQYCQIIAPILNKILMLKNENDELKRLRDFILPMLMNGQVKVKGRAI